MVELKLLERGGKGMPNQVYNILIQDENIQILKSGNIIYEVSIKNKTLNLAELYNRMSVDINDEYFYVEGLSKIESPQNDSERIFNNTLDFMSSLLVALNKKLKELREQPSTDTF